MFPEESTTKVWVLPDQTDAPSVPLRRAARRTSLCVGADRPWLRLHPFACRRCGTRRDGATEPYDDVFDDAECSAGVYTEAKGLLAHEVQRSLLSR
jgi:hypothetical protein